MLIKVVYKKIKISLPIQIVWNAKNVGGGVYFIIILKSKTSILLPYIIDGTCQERRDVKCNVLIKMEVFLFMKKFAPYVRTNKK